ncbi:uncharacterized protein [Argopecten irradians]|uniref:uncharacterized protein n=1 Tax=Argopecten irradians TaxID=31199 RepID=UPI0037196A5E
MTTYVTEFKPQQDGESDSRRKYSSLSHMIRPILFMMKVFGIYFQETSSIGQESDTEHSVTKHKPKVAFFKWYSVCMTVLSGLNVARYLPSFWVGVDFVPHLTVSRVILICWIVQCFFYRLCLLHAFWCDNRLAEYFSFFDKLMTDTCHVHLKPTCVKARRCSIIVVILTCFVILLTSSTNVYFLVTSTDPGYMTSVCNPFPQTLGFKIFFLVLHTVEIGAWTVPVGFQVTLLIILRDTFTSFTNELCKITKDERGHLWQKMEDIRGKHLQLCKAVAILDRDTKYLISVNFSTNIFLVCFILYQMVATNIQIHVMGYIMFAFWLVMNFSFIASVSITAAQVNEQVRFGVTL